MTPEIASFLLNLLAQTGYNGSPNELRVMLERHDEAIRQLTEITEPER